MGSLQSNTVAKRPDYWKNITAAAALRAKSIYGPIEIDLNSSANWDKIYPRLKEMYLKSNVVTEEEKRDFRKKELYSYLDKMLNSRNRSNSKLNLKEVHELFLDAITDYYKVDHTGIMDGYAPLRSIEMIFMYRNYFDLNFKDLEEFSTVYMESPIAEIRIWASQKLAAIKLKSEPFEFKFISTTGETIDLNSLRGKVVLLDFWATWCKVCIGRMPQIKEVYNKYKDQGFEVLSISIDPLSNLHAIQEVEEKVGAHWPLFIIGGKNRDDYSNSLFKAIWDKYGFYGVPQLLLLDKGGLMVEYNNILLNGDFEPLVKKLLSQPSVNTKNK